MNCAYIPLRDRSGSFRRVAKVSMEDLMRVCDHRWYLTSHGYAKTKIGREDVYMHRFILGLSRGDKRTADHINGDTLDNRRENLRAVTHQQNLQNRIGLRGGKRTSRYRNVSWSTHRNKWCVFACIDAKTRYLGAFDDEDEAGAFAAQWRAENMPGSIEAVRPREAA